MSFALLVCFVVPIYAALLREQKLTIELWQNSEARAQIPSSMLLMTSKRARGGRALPPSDPPLEDCAWVAMGRLRSWRLPGTHSPGSSRLRELPSLDCSEEQTRRPGEGPRLPSPSRPQHLGRNQGLLWRPPVCAGCPSPPRRRRLPATPSSCRAS